MLEVGYLEFSKIEIFVVVMTSSIFHFVADAPGTKIIILYDAEIKFHMFSCDIKSFEDVYFYKYFIFNFKNCSMIDYAGFRGPRLHSSNIVICSANKDNKVIG